MTLQDTDPASPVAWLRNLTGAECKPDGRCYDIVFADPKNAQYRPLYTHPPAPAVGAEEVARFLRQAFFDGSLHAPNFDMYCDAGRRSAAAHFTNALLSVKPGG